MKTFAISRRFTLSLLAGVVALSLAAFAATLANTEPAHAVGKKLTAAKIKRVVDGDTVIVTVKGKDHRVRLIGVDCPESVHPDASKNTKAGKKAAAYTKSKLAVGKKVWLQKDKSNTDYYGRWLRYLWTKKPTNIKSTTQVKKYMFNANLVKKGYAQAKRYAPDTYYAKTFEKLQRYATSRGLGVSYMWS